MPARGLAVDYPTVRAESDALDAARLIESKRLPGLIVLDDTGKPSTVLAAVQVTRFIVPYYLQVDPTLVRLVDEANADKLCAMLKGKRVRDLLPPKQRESLVVEPIATVMRIAELMERERTPMVAVADEQGELLGAVTLFELLHAMLPA